MRSQSGLQRLIIVCVATMLIAVPATNSLVFSAKTQPLSRQREMQSRMAMIPSALPVASRNVDRAWLARERQPQHHTEAQASSFYCCDFCWTRYENCLNHGGDEATCSAVICSCMLGCGVCPLCE